MTTKTIKKTVEETTENGKVSKKTIAVEIAMMKDDVEIGRLNMSAFGGNFNINRNIDDIEALGTAIANVLNPGAV